MRNLKSKTLVVNVFTMGFIYVVLIFPFQNAQSQISHGGQPHSFTQPGLTPEIKTVYMDELDTRTLIAEDEIGNSKGNPYRFGIDIPVDLNLQNSGTWDDLPNGDRVWRLKIRSQGAYSVNLIFDHWLMPEGATFFVFSEDKTHVIGSFNQTNNKKHRKFSTTPVKGASIVLEYFEPATVASLGEVSVEYVIHAYRPVFFTKKSKGGGRGFGDSGACNNDVNCPVGVGWENEINGSLLYLLSNNSRVCSGSMLNNVRNDATPYFLSANHCFSNDYSTWIFMFNYQSPSCTNVVDGPTNETVSGSSLKARRNNTDFMLFELSSNPPASYNVYLCGWSNVDVASPSAVSIHHPAHDIKKISFENDLLASDTWAGTANSHWRVPDWDDGTTEPGSSGSPLFDNNHRVIGQLSGGGAACGNNQPDYYGKIAASWNGNNASSRLKDWLDPDNTSASVLDGLNLSTPNFNLDATVLNIEGIDGLSCTFTFTPQVTILNAGVDPLVSLILTYGISGGTMQTYNWTGLLNFGQSETITLSAFTVSAGNYTYEVTISNPNGSSDQNTANDQITFPFETINGDDVSVNLITDGYGDETSFEIQTVGGIVIYSQSGFDDNTTYNLDYCLEVGECYNFVIYDSYGDGICCDFGNGSYTVYMPDGSVAGTGGQFTFSETVNFCLTITAPPQAAFTASSTTICTGESITFTDQSLNTPTSWSWSFPGGTPSSSSQPNPTITYNIGGQHDASLSVTNSLGSDSHNITDYITAHQSPNGSVYITHESSAGAEDGSMWANISGGSPPYSYLWSTGSTNNSIQNLATGTYTLTVSDANGCTYVRTILNLNTTGVDNPDIMPVSIFPNPANEYVIVNIENKVNLNESQLQVWDMKGKKLINTHYIKHQNRIEISSLTSGVYTVIVRSGEKTGILRFVKH